MEETERIPEERLNSCKITISTKGVFSGEVKVYKDDDKQALENAKERAKELKEYLDKMNGNRGE